MAQNGTDCGQGAGGGPGAGGAAGEGAGGGVLSPSILRRTMRIHESEADDRMSSYR